MKYLKKFNESSKPLLQVLSDISNNIDNTDRTEVNQFGYGLKIYCLNDGVDNNIRFTYDGSNYIINTLTLSNGITYFLKKDGNKLLIDQGTLSYFYKKLNDYCESQFYKKLFRIISDVQDVMKTFYINVYDRLDEFEVVKNGRIDEVSVSSLYNYYNIEE